MIRILQKSLSENQLTVKFLQNSSIIVIGIPVANHGIIIEFYNNFDQNSGWKCSFAKSITAEFFKNFDHLPYFTIFFLWQSIQLLPRLIFFALAGKKDDNRAFCYYIKMVIQVMYRLAQPKYILSAQSNHS